MLLVGVILLLPGLCSLLFMLTMISEIGIGGPIGEAIIVLWIVCFFVSAIGIALIYAAHKDAKKAR
jgi:hypothetical protein